MNRVKMILVIVVLALLAIFLWQRIAGAAPAPKVTICHATSSAENPWTRNVVSENAIGGHFNNPGSPKAGHEDDVLLQGDVPCPTVNEEPEEPVDEPEEPEEEPETPTTPTDTSTPRTTTVAPVEEPVVEMQGK